MKWTLLVLLFGMSLRASAAEETAASPETAPAVTAASADADVAEDKIPLNFGAKKSEAAGESQAGRVFAGFVLLALMAGGAWYLKRKGLNPGQRKNAPQIKVLNQHFLGPKKSLAIIHVAGESILIGVTDQNISLIKPLSLIDDEVPAEVPSAFSGVIGAKAADADGDDEDFQMSGLAQLKDSVRGRLQNMRSLE